MKVGWSLTGAHTDFQYIGMVIHNHKDESNRSKGLKRETLAALPILVKDTLSLFLALAHEAKARLAPAG
jgi:hypothetical protein